MSHCRENYGFKLPDGGSGGDGGDVYFKATSRLNNLYELRRAHFKGNNGKPGKSQMANGTDGKDIEYSVPLGTEIYEIKRNNKKLSNQAIGKNEVKLKLGDLDNEGSKLRLASGGLGGAGNYKVKQVTMLEKGTPGE